MKASGTTTPVILLLLLAAGCAGEIVHPPGVLVEEKPEQVKLKKKETWTEGDYEITALAEFDLRARVLSVKKYRFDRESDLSPVDLALGWGPMSDSENLDEIDISQRNRWYYWNTDNRPIPRKEIERNSANMHMIPADEEIQETLKEIRRGHLIELSGYLVAVRADDGWKWKSSTSRGDTGNGSCELIWVEDLSILN